ncbi:MAG: GNAT family N-acetyltransferase [Kiritimatiellia bacterium]
MSVIIRPEKPADIPAVRALNEAAFGQTVEADIVDAVRAECRSAVSLVAEDEGRIVGHIFFSPVVVSDDMESVRGMGLAPMAVLPERQRQGIGSALVREGIEKLRQKGCPFIVVLGHPAFYPRFGFMPASRKGVFCQWDGVPDEAFMILILDKSVMAGAAGTARYREEFDQAVQ